MFVSGGIVQPQTVLRRQASASWEGNPALQSSPSSGLPGLPCNSRAVLHPSPSHSRLTLSPSLPQGAQQLSDAPSSFDPTRPPLFRVDNCGPSEHLQLPAKASHRRPGRLDPRLHHRQQPVQAPRPPPSTQLARWPTVGVPPLAMAESAMHTCSTGSRPPWMACKLPRVSRASQTLSLPPAAISHPAPSSVCFSLPSTARPSVSSLVPTR